MQLAQPLGFSPHHVENYKRSPCAGLGLKEGQTNRPQAQHRYTTITALQEKLNLLAEESVSMRVLQLLPFAVLAIAQQIFSDQLCKTDLGPSSVHPVPSSTKVISIPLTATKKVCATQLITITPTLVTSTITSTSTSTSVTTAPQVTNTETITNTGKSSVLRIGWDAPC